MTASVILAALDLPESSLVDRRVPKKLLLENGAPATADKRLITEGVEELLWIAALKPNTIAVPEYRNDVREYLEIAVLRLALRSRVRTNRLVELVHRAVPYPVLLLTEGKSTGLSLAHKRWSQGESGRVVLDGDVIDIKWDKVLDGPRRMVFCNALSLGHQPRGTLFALYQGWINTLQALEAARLTGTFAMPVSAEHTAIRAAALKECAHLDSEIYRLRTAAAREKQMGRQVELNMELKRVEAALAAARARL